MMQSSDENYRIPRVNTVGKVSVERLVLDRENPRLINTNDNAEDVSIVAQLYRGEDLSELLQSIAANGYLNVEPLIVLLKQNNYLTVLEGNRRLAAIRLFLKPNLVKDIFTEERLRIRIPDISDQHKRTLKEILVYRVDSRESARSYIGFKHINGAARWQSYAKAKFAAKWYRSDNISLTEIANRIGDKHDTIKRMVNAIYVLEQAERVGIFDIDDRMNPRFNFSHLYTALSRGTYMKFLGLKSSWSNYDPGPNPVPQEKLKCLTDVLKWIYGSKEEDMDPIIRSQNPDIKNLGDVLVNNQGLITLRETKSLSQAFDSIQPAGWKFSAALVRARRELQEASKSLRGFDGEDRLLAEIAEDISETAQAIHQRMRDKIRNFARESE